MALILAAPGRGFAAVDQAPRTWWQPLLLIALLNGVLLHLIYDRVIVPEQLEAIARAEIEGEELERAQSFIESGAARAMALSAAVLGTPLASLAGAAILHVVAGVLLGGAAGFVRSWAVMCYALLVSIPENAAKVPVMLADQSAQVSFGPALFLSPREPSPFLFNLLSQVDLFSIWKVVLLGLGLAIVHRLDRPPVLAACFMLWALWGVAAAALATAIGR